MKKSRQNLALLVATLMATSVMGGCAKGTSASSSSTTSTADGNNAVQAEAVALKGWGAARFDGTTGIQSYSDQSSWKQIEADTGIRVDWTVVADGPTQFGLMMASGDFPDFFVGIGAQSMEEYGMKGALMPIETLIDQHIPSLKAAMEADPSLRGSVTSADGHVYFFPRILGEVGTRCWASWMIREDWLDQVGMKVPLNTDELYTVLTAFKEKIGAKKPLSGDPRALIWAFGVGSRGIGYGAAHL